MARCLSHVMEIEAYRREKQGCHYDMWKFQKWMKLDYHYDMWKFQKGMKLGCHYARDSPLIWDITSHLHGIAVRHDTFQWHWFMMHTLWIALLWAMEISVLKLFLFWAVQLFCFLLYSITSGIIVIYYIVSFTRMWCDVV